MKILLAVLLCFVTVPALGDDTFEYQTKAKLKDINDGDTAKIAIRFYGIDTPEKKQKCEDAQGRCYACGQTSKKALVDLLGGKIVTVKFTGEGTYGRVVASIERDGKDLNLEMVRQGHAVAYLQYLKGDMKKKYSTAQDEAKAAKRGIWQGKFIVPSDWRNRKERLSCERGE